MLEEYVDGTNQRVAEFVYSESSDPAGLVVGRREYYTSTTTINSTAVPIESNGRRFVQWTVNGVRQETPVGVAASQLRLVLDRDYSAVAVYVSVADDADGDGVPDWYEMFHYGTISFGPESDSDEDGVTLIDEYIKGSQPRIADSAADGGMVEGGVARARSSLTALEFGESRHRYLERSSPGGIVGRLEYLADATPVTTSIAPTEVGGYRFVQWTVNGVRQVGPQGVSPEQITFALAADTVAEAFYVPAVRDADNDGVPDWFELYYFGGTATQPGDDSDGDGRSLAEEYALGLSPIRKEWRLQQVSQPSGIVAGRDEYLADGSPVLTDNITEPPLGMEFGQWKINGLRQETENGVAVRSIQFNISADTVAMAEFVLREQDEDDDGVPDWYEIRNYGDLEQSAVSDSDGDGRSLLDEYLTGTQPRIPDSANDGLIVEGGIGRGRGDSTTLIFSEAYRRYAESSLPRGIFARDAVLLQGSSISTPEALSNLGSYRFVHWLLNGVRQEGANGLPLTQLTFLLSEDAVAQAIYVESSQDQDIDEVPDWFEIYYYGNIGQAGASDSDGDGRTLLEEYRDETSPVVPEWRYVERNLASGEDTRNLLLPQGTELTTPFAAPDESGQRFVHWLLNGERQVAPSGIPKMQLQILLDRNVTAEAVYLDAATDADGDGLPDWFESFHFGDIFQGPTSDTDGDGRTLLEEYLLGGNPLIHDAASGGALAEGGIARARGAAVALSFQFFPAGQVLTGAGQGIFSDPYTGTAGGFVMSGGMSAPALGDWDGDGDLDLIVGGAGGAVRMLINRGSAFAPLYEEVSWPALTDWPTGAVYPAFGDWDNDGRADLAVGSDDGVVRFYRSTTNGFQPVGRLPVGSGSVYPAFLPTPGGPDLLVLHGTSGLVERFTRGSGALPYGSATETNFLGEPVLAGRSLSVWDTDGDGHLDVVASDADGRMWLFLGRADGSFFLKSKVYAGAFNGFRPGLSSAVADFDGDGDEDVIGGGSDGRLVYLRNPARHLRITPAIATVGVGESIAFSSIDDDGALAWSLGVARSGGTVVAATGAYTAGSSPGIDQVMVRNAAGRNGVAWINVIERGGGEGKKWQALLVDGRRGPNDPVWPAANALSLRAKEVLKYRGLAEADIRWLGHGSDADEKPTRAALQAALAEGAWMGAETDALLIYMVDHGRVSGSDGLFLLSESESVRGTELDAWLDALQTARPGLSVVVVVESCFGGRVAGPLGQADGFSNRRLVFSSSGADELAHLAANGLVSYSSMWWSAVAAGKSLQVAHQEAVAAMAGLQTPGTGADGAGLAAGQVGSDQVSGSGRPVVAAVGGDIALQGTQEATLAVNVESSFGIERVWGVIVPPNYSPSGDDPVVDLPEVVLNKDQATGSWTATVGGFSEGGAPYTVLLQARDVWGQVSAPALLRVEQAGVRNRVIVFAPGEESWLGAPVAGSLAEYAREASLLRRVRSEDIRVYADAALGVESALPATAEELQQAIETWANADDKLGALTLYLVGQGAQDGLVCANGDTVTPQDLQQWLDNLQDASGATVQVIADADYSGSFVTGSGSATHRRIVVSSSGATQRNTFASGQWSNVTRWIWNAIARGRDLRESFGEALDLAKLLGLNVPALFDDNGDGMFNKLSDGLKAINAFVGSAYVTADDPPFIGRASAAMEVGRGQAARFWVADVVMPDGGAPQSVWAEVLGPDGTGRGSLQLWLNEDKERYEGSFATFREAGRYVIFVQAGEPGNPAKTTPPAAVQVYYDTAAPGTVAATGLLPVQTLPADGQAMPVESESGAEWKIDLQRGQRMVFEANAVSAQRNVALELIGSGDQVLARADDWGNGFGEKISGWEVPQDGTYVVKASFTAGGRGAAESSVRAFVRYEEGAADPVNLQSQSINFTLPATRSLADGALALQATATSSLPVRFEVISGPATITNNSLVANTAGTVVVRALQDGDATYQSALPVEHSITITEEQSPYEVWARSVFGPDTATQGGPDHDFDGDGQSNHQEWRAKTDPRDANSRFQIASTDQTPEAFTIRWQAQDGVTYRILYSTNLNTWQELPNSTRTGSGSTATHTDTDITNHSGKFYKLEIVE